MALSVAASGCGSNSNDPSAVVADAGPQDAGWECTGLDSCAEGEFCDQETHTCSECTEPVMPACDNGGVADWYYGRGCLGKVCCEFGTELDQNTGTCVGFPSLELVACPWRRSYECYIRMVAATDDPTMPLPTVTTAETIDGTFVFALKNTGKGTLHIDSMGLTPESSPELHMVTAPRTELPGGETMVIQFAYTPSDHTRDQGEFVLISDAAGAIEQRWEVIGDTTWTSCTKETVKQTCIAGQYCDSAVEPATCADCFDPLDPMCANGTTVAVEPEGSYKCVEFKCVCPQGDVYVNARGCKPIVPCTATCNDCRHLCTTFPSKFCDETTTVETCLD